MIEYAILSDTARKRLLSSERSSETARPAGRVSSSCRINQLLNAAVNRAANGFSKETVSGKQQASP